MTRARSGPASLHRAQLTEREALLFEAGIKLGGLFHQYIGIPVSARTAPHLERAIESALSLQPYVRSVRVDIDPARGPPMGRGAFRYRYLTAEMLTARVRLSNGATHLTATLRSRPGPSLPADERGAGRWTVELAQVRFSTET